MFGIHTKLLGVDRFRGQMLGGRAMKGKYFFLAAWLALVIGAASTRGQVAIELVPVSADAPPEQNPTPDGWSISGNEITMERGGRKVWLEIRIGDWDPDDTGVRLKVWGVRIDEFGGYSSGLEGTLSQAFFPCTTHSECREAFGSALYCVNRTYCSPGFIDELRNDYVHFGIDALLVVVDFHHANMQFASTIFDPADAADDPEPFPIAGLYAGTLVVQVPPDAKGTFTIGMIHSIESLETALLDQNNDRIPVGPLVSAKITVELGQCCFAVDTEQPDCIDAVTRDDCRALQQRSYFVAGNTCAEACLDCFLPSPPEPGRIPVAGGNLAVSTTNRFLNFSAGDPGHTQAILVTQVGAPPPFDVRNGQQWYVAAPHRVCENSGQGLNVSPPDCGPAPGLTQSWFWAAPLFCDEQNAHFMDWSTLEQHCVDGSNDGSGCISDGDCPNGSCGSDGVVHVYHEGIIPSGMVTGGGASAIPAEYEIQVVDSFCSFQADSFFSDPLTLTQARWGDVVKDCMGCPCGPPEGSVNVVTDVVSILDKFSNVACALAKSRADLQPGEIDFKIDIFDVVRALGGFTGVGYPFPPDGDPCHGAVLQTESLRSRTR